MRAARLACILQRRAVAVPRLLGGGTRLKIVEAMTMGKAIVSTTLGGSMRPPGRGPLVRDEPANANYQAQVNIFGAGTG